MCVFVYLSVVCLCVLKFVYTCCECVVFAGVCAVFVTRMFGVFVWCFGCLACVALMFFVLTCLPCSFKVCCMLLSGCGVL